jgi:hypothetical protein
MTVLNSFPPLQGAIAYAESLKSYLNACQDELSSPRTQAVIARAENNVGIGVMLGELLPVTWRAAFNVLFRPSLAPWKSVKEFEAFRHEIRALFYTVRETMDSIRKTAEMLQALTGRKPEGMDRLLTLIEGARQLEENVFHDWPSFVEPCCPTDSLSVDESLAEALGITVEEARQKIGARRRELIASFPRS